MMTKKQVLKMLEEIYLTYPNTKEVTQKMVDVWHKHFKNEDHERVEKNLQRYIRENKFPPTVADIFPRKSPVPSAEETKKMMQKKEDELPDEPVSLEEQKAIMIKEFRQTNMPEETIQKYCDQFDRRMKARHGG